MKQRLYYQKIWDELSKAKNMIFLAGPRQAGKTTLSHIIAKTYSNHLYFNWDIHENRKMFLDNPIFFEQVQRFDNSLPLIMLDEIHKQEFKN